MHNTYVPSVVTAVRLNQTTVGVSIPDTKAPRLGRGATQSSSTDVRLGRNDARRQESHSPLVLGQETHHTGKKVQGHTTKEERRAKLDQLEAFLAGNSHFCTESWHASIVLVVKKAVHSVDLPPVWLGAHALPQGQIEAAQNCRPLVQ